ncbi:LPS-assembly lipoprotein LptE [Planctobacterium marinum]|uniref:LPS-assembly lipoprotein LptE n=1 Tax=Planctobacterium marinum TaxID=1631968 RepID=UPI001E4C9F11|nr:LPS assembly lipoprotein LptE [Planctobacterium marinum]MCC2605636.1 LPS assembly lipoprotein LptE [Planctobacterium marinum]
MSKATILAGIAVAITLMSGCGFKLRNDFQIADQFQKVRVQNATQKSPLTDVLIRRLAVYSAEVINQTHPKEHHQFQVPTLFILPEKLERRLLSLFPTGQVAEYELIYFCQYQVQMPSGDIRDFEFQLTREYQDDPDQVLAKSRELDLILAEMRRQAADRIIRQLSKTDNQN